MVVLTCLSGQIYQLTWENYAEKTQNTISENRGRETQSG